MPTIRQRSNDDLVAGTELVEHIAGDVTKHPGHSVPLHRIAD